MTTSMENLPNSDGAEIGLFGESDSELRIAIASDPNYRSHLYEMARERSQRKAALATHRSKYKTAALSESDPGFKRLQQAYPEYSIEPGVATTMTGHPFSRDSRYLDSRLVREVFISRQRDVVLGKAYDGSTFDVLIKDVGSNVREVCRSEPVGTVHMCCPVLSVSDNDRYYSTQRYLCDSLTRSVMLNRDHAARRYLSSLMASDGIARCSLPSQYCTITAPYLTFIHSSYDLTIEDTVRILDQSKANEAFFVFLFDPEILTSSTEGRIPFHGVYWRKIGVGSSSCIRFDFHDGQNSYIHRMDTYLALLGASRIVSPSTCRAYIFSCVRFSNYTMYIKASVDVRPQATTELIVRSIPICDGSPDSVFIRTWRWDTIASGPEHMVPVTLTCSRIFWERLLTYGKSYCTQGKFTVATMQQAAASFSSDLTVSGRQYNTGCKNALEMSTIVLSAWIVIFINNYEIGKAQQTIKMDEEKVRSFNESGTFSRIFKTILGKRNKRAHCSSTSAHPHDSDLVIKTANVFTTLHNADETVAHKNFYENFFSFLCHMWISERKYPISVSDSVTVVNLEMHVSSIMNNLCDVYYPYFAKPSAEDKEKMIIEEKTLNSILTAPLATECTHVNETECVCDQTGLRAFPVPGDGNCFYHCLKVLLDIVDIKDVKRRLLRSRHNKLSAANRDRLLAESGKDAWAENNIIRLAAIEFNVCICIHRAHDTCTRFNSKALTIIHIKLSNDHFEPLLRNPTCDPLIKLVLPVDELVIDKDASVNYECYNDIISRYCLNTHTDKVRHDLSMASTHYHKSCSLGHCGFDTSYGVLLANAVNSIEVKIHPRVLDVNHVNGSSLQYFVDRLKARTVSLQFGASDEFVEPSGDYEKFQAFPGDNLEVVKHLDKFDIISVNPSQYKDRLSFVYDKIVERDLHSSLSLLEKLDVGGTFLMGVPVTMTETILTIVSSCKRIFSSVALVRSQFVPPHNPWVIVVCTGYTGEKYQPDVVSSTLREFVQVLVEKLDFPKACQQIISAAINRKIVGIDHCEYKAAMASVTPKFSESVITGGARRINITLELPLFSKDIYGVSFEDAKMRHEMELTRFLMSKLSSHCPNVLNAYWLDQTVHPELSDDAMQAAFVLYDVVKNNRTVVTTKYNKFDYLNGCSEPKFVYGSYFDYAIQWFQSLIESAESRLTTAIVASDDQTPMHAKVFNTAAAAVLAVVASSVKSEVELPKPKRYTPKIVTSDVPFDMAYEAVDYVSNVASTLCMALPVNSDKDVPSEVVDTTDDSDSRVEVPPDLINLFGSLPRVKVSDCYD